MRSLESSLEWVHGCVPELEKCLVNSGQDIARAVETFHRVTSRRQAVSGTVGSVKCARMYIQI